MRTTEKTIKDLLVQKPNKETPFIIHESWINIIEKNGYQEFHKHEGSFGSVFYI